MKQNRFNELRNTTNRYVFNRYYKEYLERKGKIRCTYCPYNKFENSDNKYYGQYWFSEQIRMPNWKMVSKNKKQWMKKPLKKKWKHSIYDSRFVWKW